MSSYTRAEAQRFNFGGMMTYVPPDRIPVGKYPLAINVRAYLGDAITPRLPQTGNLLASNLASLIHSLRRMDDTTSPPTNSTSSGPNACGTGTDTPVGGGTAWSNPGNITVQDGNYATITVNKAGNTTQGPNPPTAAVGWTNSSNIFVKDGVYATNAIPPGLNSATLSATGFGFAIPATATILGIAVSIVRADLSFSGKLMDNTVKLLKAGTPTGNNEASGTTWASSSQTVNYGGSTDLWGTTWTPTDVNNANFGMELIVHNGSPSNTVTAGVDFVSIQVYYSVPAITSDYLTGTNLGFAIPGGSTIAGILVQIKGFQTSGNWITVQMLKAGVGNGNPRTVILPSSNGFVSSGGASILWGGAWLPADINNVNFGVQIQAINLGPNPSTFNVDFVEITVYYYTSSPPVNFVYVSGAGTSVYVNTTQVQTGMSGKRLALVPFRPNSSVAPWMYVGDSSQMVKIRSDGTTYKTGIQEPQTLPTLATSGAGPITGQIYYAYEYRSSKTGAVSNPSPTAHSQFITAASNDISVTCTASTDPQADLIDIYRFGAGLLAYTYITTILNSAPQFVDNLSDVSVSNNPLMSFSNYEPFPSIDIPRTGTLSTTAGTAAGTVNLSRVSGDFFNVRWTYGTIITLSQTGSTQTTNLILFNRPASNSAAIAQIQPVGATLPNATYTFTITGAILAAQPLPALWGPTDNTAFMFACGDPLRPGTLYFTTGNNPDSAAQTNSIEITSPSEPLIGGCIVAGLGLVMSAERGWLIYPNFAQATATIIGVIGSPFSTIPTITDRGLVAKEGICTDAGNPSGGGTVWFIAKDSIRQSISGVGSSSITDDIYNLFPHDGQPQQPYIIAGFSVVPPDYTQPDGMALRFSQGHVYFDYIGLDGNRYTLVYDVAHTAWGVDSYAAVAAIHADDTGMFISSTSTPIGSLMGCSDGSIRQLSPTGNESGAAILLTPTLDNGDQRAVKHFGDIYLESTSQIANAFTVLVYSSRYNTLETTAPPGAPGTVGNRVGTIIEINSGNGTYATDISLIILVQVNSVGNAIHLWQPSILPQPETTGQRLTDWDDGGVAGTKFYQGVIVEADTFGQVKNFSVQSEDQTLTTLAEIGAGSTFNGRSRKAFSLTVPVISHQVRLVPQDTVPWRLFSLEWIWEPYPEVAFEWHSEQISHGVEGYMHIGDINIAYLTPNPSPPVTFTLVPDIGSPQVMSLPGTGGVQAKILVTPPAFKCKLVSYNLSCSAGFRVWKEDIEVKVGQWGRSGPYQLVRPFGGESSEGAQV